MFSLLLVVKNWTAGVQTDRNAELVREESWTMSGAVEELVHCTYDVVPTRAQSRNTCEDASPKNNVSDGVAKEETAPEMSCGVTDPNTATSMMGRLARAEDSGDDAAGGTEGNESTYSTTFLAVVVSEIKMR